MQTVLAGSWNFFTGSEPVVLVLLAKGSGQTHAMGRHSHGDRILCALRCKILMYTAV